MPIMAIFQCKQRQDRGSHFTWLRPYKRWEGLVTVPAQFKEGLGTDGYPGTQKIIKVAIKEENNGGSTMGKGAGKPWSSELSLTLPISVYGIRALTLTGHIPTFLSVLLQSHTARFGDSITCTQNMTPGKEYLGKPTLNHRS